jgi:hypothetical protein
MNGRGLGRRGCKLGGKRKTKKGKKNLAWGHKKGMGETKLSNYTKPKNEFYAIGAMVGVGSQRPSRGPKMSNNNRICDVTRELLSNVILPH